MIFSQPVSRFASSPFAIGGVLLLALFLRGWNLHAVGFTADEVSEVLDARKPYADIVADRDDDLFPPLYRLSLASWNRLWGDERAARWLNVAFGVLTVGVMLRIGAYHLGEAARVWPALLAACSPFPIHFCREGRAYALFVLMAAIAWWLTLRVMRQGSLRNWLLAGAAYAAAIYTHWYVAPLVTLLWLTAAWSSIPREGWRPWAFGTLCSAVLLAPAPGMLLQAMRDLKHEKLYAGVDVETVGYLYFAQAAGFTVGPSMLELRSIPASEGIRQMAPWIAVVGAAYAILFFRGLQAFEQRSFLMLSLLAFLAIVPMFAILSGLIHHSFVFRYYAWLTIPYAILLGAGAARGAWLSRLALAMLLAVGAVAWGNKLHNPRYAEEDARAVVAKLNSAGPERQVLVASDYMRQALEYYDEPARFTSFPIRTDRQEQIPSRLAEFTAKLNPGDSYWFVSQWLPTDDPRYPIRERVVKDLGAKFVKQENQFVIYEGQVE